MTIDMDYLDAMVEDAALTGQVMVGTKPEWVAKHAPDLLHLADADARGPNWSAEDDEYIRQNLAYFGYEGVAQELGRSTVAIRIRAKRLDVPGPTRHPDFISANLIGELLEMCPKRIAGYIDAGWMPGWYPTSQGTCRIVHRGILARWLLNPMNWVYFDPERVQDAKLRRMLRLRAQRWGDAWWDTNAVAAYHGVHVKDVTRLIKFGRIERAVNVKFTESRWGKWYVLRSVATDPGLVFPKRGDDLSEFVDGQDDFMVLGYALGLPFMVIAKMCGLDERRLDYRLRHLRKRGDLVQVATRAGVRFRDGRVFADWRDYAVRFPAIGRRVDDYLAGRYSLTAVKQVQQILRVWSGWHAQEQPDLLRAQKSLIGGGGRLKRAVTRAEKAREELQKYGLDPLGVRDE